MERAFDDRKDAPPLPPPPFAADKGDEWERGCSDDAPSVVLALSERRPGLEVVREEEEEDRLFPLRQSGRSYGLLAHLAS
jgi:hypothetical protein